MRKEGRYKGRMNDVKGGRKKLIMADIMGGRMLLRKK